MFKERHFLFLGTTLFFCVVKPVSRLTLRNTKQERATVTRCKAISTKPVFDITDGRTDGRTDRRTDGWTDGRTDGWTDQPTNQPT
jgi:hypothetical protein